VASVIQPISKLKAMSGTCLIGMVDGIGRLPSGEQVATALW
jgi:hypothetical protein